MVDETRLAAAVVAQQQHHRILRVVHGARVQGPVIAVAHGLHHVLSESNALLDYLVLHWLEFNMSRLCPAFSTLKETYLSMVLLEWNQ
jgi:hypothetical protein